MATEKQTQSAATSPAVIAAALTAQQSGPSAFPPELLELLRLDLAQRQKALAEEEDKKRQAELIRQQTLQTMAVIEEQQMAKQEGCAHRHEQGWSLLAGQRDSKRVVHYLCQRCQKTWDSAENKPPASILPTHEHIGGTN